MDKASWGDTSLKLSNSVFIQLTILSSIAAMWKLQDMKQISVILRLLGLLCIGTHTKVWMSSLFSPPVTLCFNLSPAGMWSGVGH